VRSATPAPPFRVFRCAARPATFSASGRPLEVSRPFRVFARTGIAGIGSAIPLCRWPLPRLCGLPGADYRWPQLSEPANPLVELDVPESVSQHALASRPKPTSSSHGLCFPTAHQGPKVHLMRALPARYVPPSGFGYPLDGFLPSIPGRFCFTPAALVGFPLRSLLLPKGIPGISARDAPTYRFSCRYTRRRSAGPARQAAVPGL